MLHVGFAKTDITAFKKGVGMLGYGLYLNTMEEIETPLYARTFAIKDKTEQLLLITICELGFITDSIKEGVLNLLAQKAPELNISEQNLLMLAQHTHSGPGGYSFYPLYNMSIPGFVPEIYTELTEKIAISILDACKHYQDCTIHYNRSEFPPEQEVAFNRSIAAYNCNPEVRKLADDEIQFGVDRNMYMLHFKNAAGKNVASINWFGVHTTSLSNDNHKLCSDNKGFAAAYLELQMQREGANYMAAFAQSSAGDVTPKFVYNPKRTYRRGYFEGKFPDDMESAKYNGQLQCKLAAKLISAEALIPIDGDIISFQKYYNFSNISIGQEFTDGIEGKVTSPACLGVSFLEGAWMDGPGASKALGYLTRQIVRSIQSWELLIARSSNDQKAKDILRKYEAQGVKDILIECGERKMLGTSDIKNLLVPGAVDASIKTFKEMHRKGSLSDKPWTAQVLPLQAVKLGNILLACFPFEITTIAAQQLKSSLLLMLAGKGIDEVILCPYANSYQGYITTRAEYNFQAYEGGHTVFGEWSLAALQTCFADLLQQLFKPVAQREHGNVYPVVFEEKELLKRSYYKRNYIIKAERKASKA